MRRKRRQSTGANSTANSLRNLGGIPSGPEALFVLREDNNLQTLRVETKGEGIRLERGREEGTGASESLTVELEEKREAKRFAFSEGDEAREPSDGKAD